MTAHVISSDSKRLETNSKSILDSEKTKQNPFAACMCPEAASFSHRKRPSPVLSAAWPLLRQPHRPLMFSYDFRFKSVDICEAATASWYPLPIGPPLSCCPASLRPHLSMIFFFCLGNFLAFWEKAI